MDSCMKITGVDLQMSENVEPEHARANVASALMRNLPQIDLLPETDIPVCICGGGPSIEGDLEQIRARWNNGQQVWALNGAHDWLLDRGITPHAAWCVDSRPENAKFYKRACHLTRYYIACRCDPLVFDTLKGQNVIIWYDASCREIVPNTKMLIGGGTTIGVKAMAGAYVLGHRRMHLFGYDSSYADDKHHAYAQPMNDGEQVLNVEVGGRTFRAAPWMINQVKNFGMISQKLAEGDCEVHVHGDGLLPWAAREMQMQMEAA